MGYFPNYTTVNSSLVNDYNSKLAEVRMKSDLKIKNK